MEARVYLAIAGLLLVPSVGRAQQACAVSTYEAESMFHSTGTSVEGGWNIFDEGYISTTHPFGAGSRVVTVIARGEAAGGAPPHMVVTIDGAEVYRYPIIASEWTAHRFNVVAGAAAREIQIHFVNDYYQNGEDRNLFVDEVTVDCGGGWTPLTLLNGWKAAADSNEPAVGLVDGVVTFRGALDGTEATSSTPFCLNDGHATGGPDYTQYRPTDVGVLTVRAALANGATGSLTLGLPVPLLDENLPEPESSYCMGISQHGAGAALGPEARALTSLEGVTFTKSAYGIVSDAVAVDLGSPAAWQPFYPMRGTDGGQQSPLPGGLPEGQGIYAKLVNGFVRFQGALESTVSAEFPVVPLLFTLPVGEGMIPGNPVYVPVTAAPLSDPLPARIVIQPSGEVIVEGALEDARVISLDGVSYSMSSPPSAVPLSLTNGWTPSSSRAVRARLANGVVRLEGAVEEGTTPTLGTLPVGMRPAETVYLVADALPVAEPATLSIDPAGSIQVVSPPLVVAASGISLDGVSFALEGPFQCVGACLNATELGRNEPSGSFETTGERWFVVSEPINGWQASQVSGRTITVNGVEVSPGEMPLPPPVNGSYYFHFSAGDYPWASWSFW